MQWTDAVWRDARVSRYSVAAHAAASQFGARRRGGDTVTIGILGGTGDEGRGLALRLAAAGYTVLVGSRDRGRAERAAGAAGAAAGAEAAGRLAGALNRDAARRSDVVFVAVPYAGMRATLVAVADALAGKVCVSIVAPIEVAGGIVRARRLEDSAAEEAARAVPAAAWAAALHTVPATRLLAAGTPVDTDTLVCADADAARTVVREILGRIPGLRAIDAGRLANARYLEGATALLIDLNRIHRAHTSLRVVGL